MVHLVSRVVVLLAACAAVSAAAARPGPASAPAAGPRGPVGPDVPMADAEKAKLAKAVLVDGSTRAAVQQACDRAASQGAAAVILPAGDYVLDAEVRVPAGLTLVGQGAKTLIRTKARNTCLFLVDANSVRFTRLKLQGADTSPSTENDTFGIRVRKARDVRIDHCELLGFSYATDFSDESTAQVDHCRIHDNTFEGAWQDGVLPESAEHKLPARYRLGKAENITIDGALVPETRVPAGQPAPVMPRLRDMGEEGVLKLPRPTGPAGR